MLYQPRLVPPRLAELWGLSPQWTEAIARRESCNCAWCGAKLRARRIAAVLLATYPVGDPSKLASSVAAWVRRPECQPLRLAEINQIEGLHDVLRALPGLAYSEYQEGVEPGAEVDRVRCENLTRLTYPDESFDLVLTSETLEHVPDLDAALREIHRILVPGGRHIFTVPVLPDVPLTFARAELMPDGTIVPRVPLIHHPGGDHGYPVFTEFGADWPDLLRNAGFETTVTLGSSTEEDLTPVFNCRKAESDSIGSAGPRLPHPREDASRSR
ncbi:methyltransferase domain-containing protein [Singulisphaera sp. Ch08]|uniref:Methyltransferase domain-containing protein n=1 Tax=Singulisphaera sp. Ch08 TaxID=3120278 RepID=A0AAU7CDR3_9BACT